MTNWNTDIHGVSRGKEGESVVSQGETPVSLYEYEMGIQNLAFYQEKYKESAAYVSTPFVFEEQVVEIELETKETHPLFDDLSGRGHHQNTSIEYSISFKERPTKEDWLPILPLDQTRVSSERLFFEEDRAKLRFSANIESVKIYRNGLQLHESEWRFLSDKEIRILYHNKNDLYTAFYTPKENSGAWKISLKDYEQQVLTTKETFLGTNVHKSITLSKMPYIRYEYIYNDESYNPNTSTYKPLSVKLVNASIIGSGRTIHKEVLPYENEEKICTYNSTLYRDKSWTPLSGYDMDTHKKFEYYQWKNKLTFTETFRNSDMRENLESNHGNADIEVSYEYLVGAFRLKAILRRNDRQKEGSGPILQEYLLRFKTMK